MNNTPSPRRDASALVLAAFLFLSAALSANAAFDYASRRSVLAWLLGAVVVPELYLAIHYFRRWQRGGARRG